ncbi:MAG: trimethylamine methyltransferase family protein [Alphaproteobacteria bacterium]|nr:trimethylamine methyltransferase family protein [Alphaproteobacteria bacterium]
MKNAELRERGGRRGGREARRALRAAPIPRDQAPIRGGLEGGRFAPLSTADIAGIHEAVLVVLEEIGFADAIPSCVKAVTDAGGYVGDDGRLKFPRALVEDTIAKAARHFTLHGQAPQHDLQPMGRKVYYGTAGAAVHVVDVEKREYRESFLADIYDAARIVDTLDNIHFFQRPMVARDMESSRDLDINTAYACLSGTTKHVGTSFIKPEHVDEIVEMCHLVAGGEEAWRARPFISMSNCFVVPPLKFAEDACRCLEAGVWAGMPILLLSAGQAGATAPAAIAGTIVQATAEVLGGLVYVNALKPGHPAIFGTWPFVSDLRTGAMSGGSGEQALLTAGCAQMAQFYDLPGGSAAGISDSKLPDYQAGYERGITDVLAGLAGLNLAYEAAGMHASLLGFCLESLIIDDDTLGQAMRCVRGIEVTGEALSVEAIRQVCIEGPGHFLGHEQTLSLMQSEYVYPSIADRTSPKEWEALDRPDLIERAVAKKREILATHHPQHVGADIDAAIRDKFDIKLPPEAMGR